MHLKEIQNEILQLHLLNHRNLVHELQQLLLHQVVVQHQGKQILDKHRPNSKPLVGWHLGELPEGDEVALQVIDDGAAHGPVIIYFGIWLLHKGVNLVRGNAQLLLAEVEDGALTSLEADSWEIHLVGTCLYGGECSTQRFVVSPELYYLAVKVDESSYDIAN